MFGKLRMSVKEVLREFHKIGSEVYTGDLAPEIRTERLKGCIEDLLRRRGLPIDLKLGKDKRVTEQGCPWYVQNERFKDLVLIYSQFRDCDTKSQYGQQSETANLSQSDRT